MNERSVNLRAKSWLDCAANGSAQGGNILPHDKIIRRVICSARLACFVA